MAEEVRAVQDAVDGDERAAIAQYEVGVERREGIGRVLDLTAEVVAEVDVLDRAGARYVGVVRGGAFADADRPRHRDYGGCRSGEGDQRAAERPVAVWLPEHVSPGQRVNYRSRFLLEMSARTAQPVVRARAG